MCFQIMVILYCSDKTFPHIVGTKLVTSQMYHQLVLHTFWGEPLVHGLRCPNYWMLQGSHWLVSPLRMFDEEFGYPLGARRVLPGVMWCRVLVVWVYWSFLDRQEQSIEFLFPHFVASADGVCIIISLCTYGLVLLALWVKRQHKKNFCRCRVISCPPPFLSMAKTRSRTSAA